MKKIKYIIIFCLVFNQFQNIHAQEKKTKRKELQFNWEHVDWAAKYEVQIRDKNNKIVLKKIVKTSRIKFYLPPGKYNIRIGVYDKFDKLAAWSDWQQTEIMKKIPKKTAALNLGIKISAGIPYVNFMSWDNRFNNTYKGFSGKIGFNFGKFILFQPSKSVRYTGFLRYFGMELEGSSIEYTGKKDFPAGLIKIKDMKGIYAGGNLYFTTDFDFPLNFIIRGGGGAVRSTITYDETSSTTISKITTEDPYYKFGCSLELTFLNYFFLEAGVDYFVTSYIDYQLKSLRYNLLLGIKL